MNRWKKLLLITLLVWLIIFLSMLCHFLQSAPHIHSMVSSPTTITTENHLLVSIQGFLNSLLMSKNHGSRHSLVGGAVAEGKVESAGGGQQWEDMKKMEGPQWTGNMSAAMLSPRLQRVLKGYLSSNKHRVAYRGQRGSWRTGQQLLCELKRWAPLRTLDGSEEPFLGLGWTHLVPSMTLQQLHSPEYRTCAVVMSAGAILNSSLGAEIDSHNAVLRFNAAPTEGFERDVGRKTSIRIINSQILARPKHQFSSSSLFRNVTLVAWDPAPYSLDLTQWFENPDYDLFSPYSERRRHHPQQPFYILHPAFIWRLWDVIQANTKDDIQPNPPSSGFIGIMLMMSLCREVDVYEYIPSARQTDLCHYYERYYDGACTLGAYHPLLYEKLLIHKMSVAAEHELKAKGKVTLRGFSAIRCGP